MPKIREYNNPISGLDVSGAGARAIAQGSEFAGRTLAQERIGPSLNRLGDAVADRYEQFIVQPEISKGAALFAQYQEKLNTQWNNAAKNTDPNDATIGQKFRDWEVEPTIDKFLSGFTTGEGKKWAEAQAAQFRTHMNQKITADLSTRAAQALSQNLDTMKNSWSVMIMNDPTTFQTTLSQADAALKTLIDNSPRLDPKTAGALTLQMQKDVKSELAKAYLIGTARANPDAAERLINEGKLSPYLSATEAKSALAFVEQQRSTKRLDEERQIRLLDRQRKLESEETTVEYLKKIRNPDPNVAASVTAMDILNDERILPGDRKELIRTIDAYDRPQALAKVSQETAASFMQRLDLPEGDPNKLVDLRELNKAFADQKLNKGDYEFLQQRLLNARTPEGQKLNEAKATLIKGVKDEIVRSNPMLGRTDFSGGVQLYLYSRMVEQKIDEMRRAGKDPSVLFNPTSPEFLGRPEVLQKYSITLEQSIHNQIEKAFGPRPKTEVTPAPLAAPPGPKKDEERLKPVPPEILKQYPGARWAPKLNKFVAPDSTSPSGWGEVPGQ